MTNHPMPSAIHHLAAGHGPWAMGSADTTSLIARGQRIFDRVFSGATDDGPNALEAYRAAKAEQGQRLGVRGDVGVLYVRGPLLKRESWISGLMGLTTYETLRRDFQVMLDEPRLKSLILHVDSPGGEANGCDELAAAIYAARGKKPITAFVSGMACSAAYWIASAADRIVVSDLAVLGSIGVVVEASNRRREGEKEFVSSMSPGKRPDINTDEGLARVQKMVDDLAHVFVKAAAKHRGVTTQTVISKFGAGGVEIGANAVKAGMADEVGQFEATLARMQARAKPVPKTNASFPQTPPAATAGAALSGSSDVAAPVPSTQEQQRAAGLASKRREEEIAASWRRAAANANGIFDFPVDDAGEAKAGAEPAKPPTGWQKAAAEANKRFGNL